MIKTSTSLSQLNLRKTNSDRICRKTLDSPYSKNYKCTIKNDEKNLLKQRQSVTKIKRSDLEDKYLLLCDENHIIKRDNIDKDAKIKQITTKLQRCTSATELRTQKSSVLHLDEENYQLKIHELEQENSKLRTQIKDSCSMFFEQDLINNDINDFNNIPGIECLDNEVRNGRATAGGIDTNLQSELNKLKTEINKLTEELIHERARTNDMKVQTNILEEKLSVVSIKKKITENVEIIMLRRKLQEKEKELAAFKDKSKLDDTTGTINACNNETCNQLNKLEHQLAREKEKNERLEKTSNDNMASKKKIYELKCELSEALTAKEILEQQLKNSEDLQHKSESQISRVNELESNLSALSMNYDNITSIKCSLEHKNDELMSKMKSLQEDNDNLCNNLEGLKAKVDFIQSKNCELESYICTLEEEKNNYCEKIASLEDNAKSFDQQLKSCYKQIKSGEKHNDCIPQTSPRITIEMDNEDEDNQNINVIIENDGLGDEFKNYSSTGIQTDYRFNADNLNKRLELLEKNAITEYLKNKDNTTSDNVEKKSSFMLSKGQSNGLHINKSETDILFNELITNLTVNDKLNIEKNINLLLRNELNMIYNRKMFLKNNDSGATNNSSSLIINSSRIDKNNSYFSNNDNINNSCDKMNQCSSPNDIKNDSNKCSLIDNSYHKSNKLSFLNETEILKYDNNCGVLEIHIDNLKLSTEGIQLLSCKHGNLINVMLNWIFYNYKELSTTDSKIGPIFGFNTTYLYKTNINKAFFDYLLNDTMQINLMTSDNKYLGKCLVKFDDIFKYPQNKIHCLLKIMSDEDNQNDYCSICNSTHNCDKNNNENITNKQDNCLYVNNKFNFLNRTRQFGILSLWLRLTCNMKLLQNYVLKKDENSNVDTECIEIKDISKSLTFNNDRFKRPSHEFLNTINDDLDSNNIKIDVENTEINAKNSTEIDLKEDEMEKNTVIKPIIHHETRRINLSEITEKKNTPTEFWSSLIPKDENLNSDFYIIKNELKVDNVSIDPNYVQLLDIESYKNAEAKNSSLLDRSSRSKENVLESELIKKNNSTHLESIVEETKSKSNSSIDILLNQKLPTLNMKSDYLVWVAKDDVLKITIEIEALRLDPHYELLTNTFIKQLYIEYSFLGYYGHLLETPKSLPTPHTYDLLLYNFRKRFHLNLHRHRKQLNLLLNLLKNNESIKFIVVSEPLEEDLKKFPSLECMEIGFALLKLGKIITSYYKDRVSIELPVLAVKYPHTNIGIMIIVVDGVIAMKEFCEAN